MLAFQAWTLCCAGLVQCFFYLSQQSLREGVEVETLTITTRTVRREHRYYLMLLWVQA